MERTDDVREEFSAILDSLKIPQYMSSIEKQGIYLRLTDFIAEKVPSSLFRYRECIERNESAFRDNQIWMSKPHVMMDKLDSKLIFHPEKLMEEIADDISDERVTQISQWLVRGAPLPDSLMCQIQRYTGIDFTEQLAQYKDAIGVKKYLAHIAKGLLRITPDTLMELSQKGEQALQYGRRIACFTETPYSEFMWNEYAGKQSGFVLEYSFPKELLVCNNHHEDCGNLWLNYPLFPVIYNKAFDTTDYLKYQLENRLLRSLGRDNNAGFFDWTFMTKGYLYKEKEYEPEQEWRLLSKIDRPNSMSSTTSDYDCIYLKPNAIYFGERIDRVKRESLLAISGTKRIQAYDIKMNPKTGVYSRIPVE